MTFRTDEMQYWDTHDVPKHTVGRLVTYKQKELQESSHDSELDDYEHFNKYLKKLDSIDAMDLYWEPRSNLNPWTKKYDLKKLDK